MSYLASNEQFHYIVTVHNFEDLQSLYDDLETEGRSPLNSKITRKVFCSDRRPSSRNTTYKLEHVEAEELRKDPRVKSVSVHPYYLGIKAGTCEITQTSTAWDKSTSEASGMKNWGLLRVNEGHARSNWGADGTVAQTGTITLGQTGKNVDIVVVDADGVNTTHPEYQVNSDGTGGSRQHLINWCQWNPEVTGTAATSYTYNFGGAAADHPLHTQGTCAGNTQGWARDANIYNIYYDASPDFNNNYNFGYVMDYVRAFHRHKDINPTTGRKNPTITNNSWGESIFPNEWAYADITAVTYRGVRHEPVTSRVFDGVYGVCSGTALLAQFSKKENAGYQVTTFGDLSQNPPTITSTPQDWVIKSSGESTFETGADETIVPPASSTLTFTGPCTVAILSDLVINAGVNSYTIGTTTTISLNGEILHQDTQTADTDFFTGQAEAVISRTYDLNSAGTYTIVFENNVPAQDGSTYFYSLMDLHVGSVGSYTASMEEITYVTPGTASGLTNWSGTLDGTYDDGWATVNTPFTIQYLGTNYNSVFVGTNGYLTFGSGSDIYFSLGYTNPPYPKVMWGANDRALRSIKTGTYGSAPNRSFKIYLGYASNYNNFSPDMFIEYEFFESTPGVFNVQMGNNGAARNVGGFSSAQLHAWGFYNEGVRIPARVPGLDADIEDAQKEGIIFVGAAGNGSWKHCLPQDPDWNNTFEMATRYPASAFNPYYYMRGSSPTAVESKADGGDYDLNTISVGALDNFMQEAKAYYSDCGTGVDLYAPGSYIMSCLSSSGVADPRDSGHLIGKFSGTSMASPQVCGVLACALELYPHMTQIEAKQYILSIAKRGQITETHGGTTDTTDLQGSQNLFLYYKNEIPSHGQTYPRNQHWLPPESGQIYPRVNRRRR